MNKVFTEQIRRNVKVYMEDILVKSLLPTNQVSDLEETVATIGKYGMKLNPKKWMFEIRQGCFLGYMVIDREIKVNPKKVEGIKKM